MIDQSTAQENSRKYGDVMARAFNDEAFKARLLADPKGVLEQEGVVVPAGIEIRAVQNTENVIYLPIPARPSDELSDEALEQVSGGATGGSASTVGTVSSYTTTFGTLSSAGSAGSA